MHAVQLVVQQLHDAVLAVLHHVAVQVLQLVRAEHAARHVLVELDHRRALHHHEVDRRARAHELVVAREAARGRARDGRVLLAALRVVGLARDHGGVLGELVGPRGARVPELVGVARVQRDRAVEARLRHLNDAAEALEHAVASRWVREREVVQHALQGRRDEEDARARRHLRLVHRVRRGAQTRQHVLGLGVREVLRLGRHARVPRDLGEGEGVGLRRHLRALQLGARRHEAVEHARLLHVHDVREQLDAPVVVERLGLELVGDRPRLVPHVARVVAEPRHLDLRDHDLLGVAPRARHAARRVQARRARGPLVDLVQDARVVLGGCDGVRHVLFLLVVDAGDLAPAPHLRALVGGRARVRQPRRARLRRGGSPRAEEPRLRRLELVDVVLVVGE